jgi:FAD synthase
MSAAAGAADDILEKHKKKAYFTFGRFQPPTLGHRLMIEGLARAAAAEGADAYVFVSSTQDKKKNPLSVEEKTAWMRKMYADIPVRIINTSKCMCRTLPSILGKLADAKYDRIKMFVGSDRTKGFAEFLPKTVEVVAIGDARNETKNTLAGMSGTKIRAAALANNVEMVKAGTGLDDSDASLLISQIKKGLGLKARRSQRCTRRARSRSI